MLLCNYSWWLLSGHSLEPWVHYIQGFPGYDENFSAWAKKVAHWACKHTCHAGGLCLNLNTAWSLSIPRETSHQAKYSL